MPSPSSESTCSGLGAGPQGQVHDLTPGILPNGLIWTMQIPAGNVDWQRDGRSARLSLRDLPLFDTFQFGGNFSASAAVDLDLRWRAVGPFEDRGSGSQVEPTSPEAFLGRFAEAHCTDRVRGWGTGFAFRTGQLTSDAFYASATASSSTSTGPTKPSKRTRAAGDASACPADRRTVS